MKNLLFAITLIFCLGFLTTSCNKDDDAVSDKSVPELLTQHSWKLVGLSEDCEKDNFETFNLDGTYAYDYGTDLCEPEEENSTGTWELSADETTLTVTSNSGGLSVTIEFTIIEITENSMTLGFGALPGGTFEPC
ncbi:MAG: lipocalin family protein [Bacteroidota bacterium]